MMGEKFKEHALVLSQREIAPGIFDLRLLTEHIAGAARAGQFVSLYCADNSRLLPRPISICEVKCSREKTGTGSRGEETGSRNDVIRLVYRVAGEGTKEFSSLKEGDFIRILGPLGNGFAACADAALQAKKAGQAPDVCLTAKAPEKYILIGGGIGLPPMLELAKELTERNAPAGEGAAGADSPAQNGTLCDVRIIAGYRDSNTFLLEDLKKYGQVYPATEDGSLGTRGTVLDAIREHDLSADVIFACGPAPMLGAVKSYAAENGTTCCLSMEERMACGIGACLACVCRSAEADSHTNVKNKRICREGPVFLAEEIEF